MSLDKIQSIRYGKEVIKIKNISLAFGGVKALTNVSFEVKKGEVFAIIGPNGAGKSSLLNVINGFYKPTSGQINFAEDFAPIANSGPAAVGSQFFQVTIATGGTVMLQVSKVANYDPALINSSESV